MYVWENSVVSYLKQKPRKNPGIIWEKFVGKIIDWNWSGLKFKWMQYIIHQSKNCIALP